MPSMWGGPTFTCATASLTNAFDLPPRGLSGTKSRVPAIQACPLFAKPAATAKGMAFAQVGVIQNDVWATFHQAQA